MTTDLWAEFSAPENVQSPVYLLKEQAAILSKKTTGLVRGFLASSSTENGGFRVSFDLESPALASYSYRLLFVEYPPEFYPLTVFAHGEKSDAANEGAFRNVLRTILSSPKTKQIVEAIMTQAVALTADAAAS